MSAEAIDYLHGKTNELFDDMVRRLTALGKRVIEAEALAETRRQEWASALTRTDRWMQEAGRARELLTDVVNGYWTDANALHGAILPAEAWLRGEPEA